MKPFLNVLLILVAVASLLCGILGIVVGTSAIHQILTAVYFVTFTVALVGITVLLPDGEKTPYAKSSSAPADTTPAESPRRKGYERA
jgi:hypothetical protein